jgi:hypothetical protein
MGKAAGIITLRMKAGTAELFTDVDKAKAKIREFGGTAKASNAEVAATVKALEGNFAGTTRAVSRFLSATLGLGPVIAAAFPVVGAVLLGKAIFDTGEKVREFFKDMREAPEKVKGAFRELNSSLRTSNDELAVTNARLENDIAKLEGRRQNTLKLALVEARVEADKLADSLEKDLDRLFKLLKENDVGVLRRIGGESGTKYIQEYFGGATGGAGFHGEIGRISDEGIAAMGRATTAKEKDAAQTAMNTQLLEAYARALQQVDKWIAAAQARGKDRTLTTVDIATGKPHQMVVPGQNVTVELEELAGARRAIASSMAGISSRAVTSSLTDRKNQLEAGKAADELTKPFREKMASLNAELDAANAKLGAAGTSAAGSVLMKAYGEAVKAIAEINKQYAETHRVLSEDEEQQIKNTAVAIARTNAESAWQEKLSQTTDQIRDRIRATQLLTDAIGKGYEAQKQASIETQVMGAVGAGNFNDPGWMAAHASDVAAIRAGITRDVEAAHAQQSAAAIDALGTQIGLENRLLAAQKLGEEEIRRITALEIVRAGIARGATGAEIAGEVTKYYAGIRLEQEKRIVATQAETGYVKALAAAQLDGAEAARKQALENKYAEMQRTGNGGAVSAERAKDEAEHQSAITAKVAQRVNVYRNELEAIEQEHAKLVEIIGANAATLDQQRALKDLEDQRLRILRDQQLSIDSAKAGLRAFFLEMQTQAKKGGQILYEGLMSGVDRVSDALSKVLTGQKAEWGALFRDLGQQMLREAIKSGIQRGIGAIGKALGIGADGKPDFTQAHPGHVIVDNLGQSAPGTQGNGLTASPIMGASGPPSWFGAVAAAAGFAIGLGAGGHGGAGPQESVSSSISYRAEGGLVSPSQAYIVGEKGPEILTGASGRVMSNAAAQRTFGGGGNSLVIGSIDARGTDHTMVEQAVYRGARAAYREAVKTSVQAVQDRRRRVPTGA